MTTKPLHPRLIPSFAHNRLSAPLALTQPGPAAQTYATGTGLMFAAYLLLIVIEYVGLSNDLPLLKTLRVATLISYSLFLLVIARWGLSDALGSRQARILTGLIIATGASVLWAYVRTYAFDAIRPLVDSLVLVVITMYLVDRASRFDKLALMFAGIVVFLVIRNLAALSNSTRSVGMVAGYFMGDGNDFAWAMVVILPLILILMFGQRRVMTRLAGLLGLAACLIGITGTQSRGGALGLAAAMLFGWLFLARRKTLGVAVIALAVVGALLAGPEGYTNRLGTIGTFEDSSAQARIQVWGAGIRMALEHPLGVGAGNFSSAYGRFYMPDAENNRISFGSAPNRWMNAHSIYIKILGEYGFLGLALLLWLLGTNLLANMASRSKLAGPGSWPVLAQLPTLLNMSLVGYAACGMFLGVLTYPHHFILTGLTLSLTRILADAQTAASQPASAVRQHPRLVTQAPAAATLRRA